MLAGVRRLGDGMVRYDTVQYSNNSVGCKVFEARENHRGSEVRMISRDVGDLNLRGGYINMVYLS